MVRAIYLFVLPSLPCPFLSVSRGDEPCRVVSQKLLLTGFQLGVAEWEALMKDWKGRGREVSQAMAVFPSEFQPALPWALPVALGPVRWPLDQGLSILTFPDPSSARHGGDSQRQLNSEWRPRPPTSCCLAAFLAFATSSAPYPFHHFNSLAWVCFLNRH